MATRVVTAGGLDYRISDDNAPRPEQLWWAVLRTRVIDELTGEPPRHGVRITTTTPHCVPRVADGGIVGLAARPRNVSGALITPGGLTAEVSVPGYLPRSLDAAIDAARRITTSTAPGDLQVTVAPPDPAPRRQFLPGRGVMLETRTPNRPQEFSLHADPLAAPAPNVVPLVDPVREDRPAAGAPWRVAGVPIVLPDQPLHRALPIAIPGRALRQPAAGAAVISAPATRLGLTGVWWTNAEIPGSSAPPHPPNLVSFAAPLAFDHPTGGLARHTARAPDGVARALARPAGAGAREIELDDVTGLATAGGDTLELEVANSAEREIVITAGYTAPGGTTRAVVRLATPLAFPHSVRAPVLNVVLTFAALGSLAREAQRGDRVLFASTLAGVATDDVLRVTGGPGGPELRFVRRFPTYDGGSSTFSHALAIAPDGTFTLPPIARVAQIQLFVEHPGQAAHDPIDLVPDSRSDTTLRILFTP